MKVNHIFNEEMLANMSSKNNSLERFAKHPTMGLGDDFSQAMLRKPREVGEDYIMLEQP